MNMRVYFLQIALALALLQGCSPHSLADFQKEGGGFCHKLAKQLQHIRTTEELLKAEPTLKEKFDRLVTLIIAAREYQEKHPEECLFDIEDFSSDQELLVELRRIYALEGGREIVERAQKEALIRLDAFERSLVKKKININHKKSSG